MTALETTLQPVIIALEADGYEVAVSEDAGAVSFRISASADACEECLSPPEVLEPMITYLLRQDGRETTKVDLQYPPEWKGEVDR